MPTCRCAEGTRGAESTNGLKSANFDGNRTCLGSRFHGCCADASNPGQARTKRRANHTNRC